DRTSGQKLGVLSGVPNQIPGARGSLALAWGAGHTLAVDFGPSVQLWNVSDPHRPTLEGDILAAQEVVPPDYMQFSQDGRLLIAATADSKRIRAVDVAAHRVKWSLVISDSALKQVALSPDGKTIAVDSGGASRGQVTLYNSATHKPQRTLATKSDGGVAFLHDGDWLVVTTGDAEPNAQGYDAKTLLPVGAPYPTSASSGFGDPIAVNSSGTMFSQAAWDIPQLWNADPAQWLALACQIAGRNLTRAEWHQYLPSRPYQITCPGLPAGQ